MLFSKKEKQSRKEYCINTASVFLIVLHVSIVVNQIFSILIALSAIRFFGGTTEIAIPTETLCNTDTTIWIRILSTHPGISSDVFIMLRVLQHSLLKCKILENDMHHYAICVRL